MAGVQKEIKVVVFDLNGTLYNEKSKDEFYKFICKKKPQKIADIFQLAYYHVLGKLHWINQTEFKENFFNYLDDIPPPQVAAYAEEFWREEYPKHFNAELKARLDAFKKQGVELFCATGGLELYVKPLFKLYPVDGFAGTRVRYDGHTYLVEGDACKADEKLRRIAQHYGNRPYRIIEAYSDSKEDILDKADKSFLVKKGKLIPYKS
jgi:HAD superfamily phosphoserine phosphatase-like hydrolase